MSLKKTWTVLCSTQSTSVENTPVHYPAVLWWCAKAVKVPDTWGPFSRQITEASRGGGGGGGTRQSPTIPFAIVGARFPTTSLEIAVYSVRVHHATRSHRGSWAHVRYCPEPKTLKNISHKNTSQHPWRGEVIRGRPGIKDLALSWWIGARFVDAGEICEHLCVGKQNRRNNEQQNRIK